MTRAILHGYIHAPCILTLFSLVSQVALANELLRVCYIPVFFFNRMPIDMICTDEKVDAYQTDASRVGLCFFPLPALLCRVHGGARFTNNGVCEAVISSLHTK